ncbi:hypothetical protein EV359DRAFT_84310 [Lentinula novae-zelandiae]|nr:hypothetical protein EV359DRAFT_84310 [Lentinula novae-zelandiae]
MADLSTISINTDHTSNFPLHSPTPTRSTTFYFDCVIFEVENVLYKIPRARLIEESSLFETMFALPPGPGNSCEGEDDDHPITLPQIKRKEWECLLRLLFRNSIAGPPDFTLDEWISILKLATKWDMSASRACSIENIAGFDGIPAQKIRLAREYHVPRYFIPCLVQLIGRSEPLTADECRDIGMECALKIVSLRERYYDPSRNDGIFRQRRVASDMSSPTNNSWNSIVSEIHKTFTDQDEFYS